MTAHRRSRCTGSSRATGFTLVELVVALAMFALIATALQAAVLLASRAIPDSKGVLPNQLAATRAMDRLMSELAYALEVTELSATAVTFRVADRDSDSIPEEIRYSWSGKSGDALTRSYNGGRPALILDDVRTLVLSYDRKTVKDPPTYSEGSETQLFSYSGGVLPAANAVSSTNWYGLYVVPTLPANAAKWRVTRVTYQARSKGSSGGETRIQVRAAQANGLPTETIIDQARMLESSLTSGFASYEAYFTGTATLAPGTGACIVFRWVSDADSCEIPSQTLAIALAGGQKFLATTNSGATWSANALAVTPMTVYGRVSTQNADTYSHYLAGVRARLCSGADANAVVHGSAQILSQPQVGAP